MTGRDTDAGLPLHTTEFFHDGRGPELQRAHWSETGTTLVAIDYRNPPGPSGAADLMQVRFLKPQVVMVTPEEVIGDRVAGLLARFRPAAMFDLGRSTWLLSFAQQHLGKCRHYQLLFYDDLFEVIAEGVEVAPGGFRRQAV